MSQNKGHYAQVNGINIYYEIHGTGEPLILLPGGFMTIEAMLSEFLDAPLPRSATEAKYDV
jgi:pimeloyl-ACP methyl ester carboxylesterase